MNVNPIQKCLNNEASSLNENIEVMPINNILEVFNRSFESFQNIYQLIHQVRKNLSSYDISILVKESENFLIAAENLSKNNTKLSKSNISEEMLSNIVKMKKQFEELFQTLPAGPRVLLQRDIDSLHKLSQVPKAETYSSKHGDYYEPKISLLGIADTLFDFCEKNGYLGTTISMKRDGLYSTSMNRMLTLVGFKNKKISYPKINGMLAMLGNRLENKNKFEDLRELINAKFMDWGFTAFEIITTSDMQDELLQKLEDDKKYGCFVLLFHKKFEKDKQELSENISVNENSNKSSNEDIKEPLNQIIEIFKQPSSEHPKLIIPSEKPIIVIEDQNNEIKIETKQSSDNKKITDLD